MGFVVKGERFVTWRKGDDESRDGASSFIYFLEARTQPRPQLLIAHPRSPVPLIMLAPG
jgi:hypothetical protein